MCHRGAWSNEAEFPVCCFSRRVEDHVDFPVSNGLCFRQRGGGVFLASLQCDVSGVVARIHANLSDATIRCEQVMSEKETKKKREERRRKNEEVSLADRSLPRFFFLLCDRGERRSRGEKKALVAFDCVRKIDDVSLGPLLDAQLCTVDSAARFHCRPIIGRQTPSSGRCYLVSGIRKRAYVRKENDTK